MIQLSVISYQLSVISGVWGVGCGVWGEGRINKNNLLSPVSCLLSPE
ncbi:MAG: hypothetical protein PX481_22465 [Microcystis sp. M53603_WE2]|nr:hypothetical protein [Microcystis sp. M53602_WE12]MDJ0541387.1 hypothetical protein [Microcystis sp. M53603_WE2]MDJ0564658.1 hypothetical protein [Microcystis sp. M49629_WE12]MDJ0606438.1 hypothetical protein [Microcystis sp. M53602_WE12]